MPRFLCIGQVSEPLVRSIRHSHATWEFCLYTAGEGMAAIGDHRVPFQTGTIICYPPHLPHDEDSPDGCLEYFMSVADFDAGGAVVPVFQDAREKPFERVMELLHQEYQLQEPGWESTTQQLFDVLLAYLDRWRHHTRHPVVEQLKRLLVAHVGDASFRLSAAMDTLPMSRDHLRRRFEQQTGRTPGGYLTDLRLNKAKQLLACGSFTIKEVAAQVGIPDQHYFSRLFRTHTGRSASDYRRHYERDKSSEMS